MPRHQHQAAALLGHEVGQVLQLPRVEVAARLDVAQDHDVVVVQAPFPFLGRREAEEGGTVLLGVEVVGGLEHDAQVDRVIPVRGRSSGSGTPSAARPQRARPSTSRRGHRPPARSGCRPPGSREAGARLRERGKRPRPRSACGAISTFRGLPSGGIGTRTVLTVSRSFGSLDPLRRCSRWTLTCGPPAVGVASPSPFGATSPGR